MIVQAVANSFKHDLFQRLAMDVFRMALYLETATLNDTTAVYMPEGEVPTTYVDGLGDPHPTGYTAGGMVLTGFVVTVGPVVFNGIRRMVATLNWVDPVWPDVSITARGALIYNASQGNRAVGIMDLGPSPIGDPRGYTSTNGSFTVQLPTAWLSVG